MHGMHHLHQRLLYCSTFGAHYERGHGVGVFAVLATQARRMTGYVYEAGRRATCSSCIALCHEELVESLWQVWQVGAGQIRSGLFKRRSAGNEPTHDSATLLSHACPSRWRWTGQPKTPRATRHRVRRKPRCASRTSPWESPLRGI
jgi:hypothetical protein